MNIIIFFIALFEMIIALVVLIGKSIAGYLLILHLLAEGMIIYFTQNVGRGKPF
jgi:hypothetical protein